MIGIKHCYACNKDKPLDDFYRHSKKPDGRQTQCKECQNAHFKVFYKAHTDQYTSTRRKYYRQNKEKISIQSKKYYQQNKEKVAIRSKTYYQSHKEQHNAWRRQWRAENKDRLAAYARKSRQDPIKHEKVRLLKMARKIFDHQGTNHSPTLESICGCIPLELYRHLCRTWEKNYGRPYNGEPCEIDHVLPLKEAKTIEDVHRLFHYSNLQLLTKEDNRTKG